MTDLRPRKAPPIDEIGDLLEAVQDSAPVGTVKPADVGASRATTNQASGSKDGKRADPYGHLLSWLGGQRHAKDEGLSRSADAMHYANNIDTLKILGPALEEAGGDMRLIQLPTGRKDAQGEEIIHWIAPRISSAEGKGHTNLLEALMDAQEAGRVYDANGNARAASAEERQANAERAAQAVINAAGPSRFGLDDAAWGAMTPEQRYETGAPVLFDQAARATTTILNPLFGVRQKIGRSALQALPYALKSGDEQLLGQLKQLIGEDVINQMTSGGGGGGNWFTQKSSPYGADGLFGSGIGKDMANWQHLAGYGGLTAGALAAATGIANSGEDRDAYNAMAAAQAAGLN